MWDFGYLIIIKHIYMNVQINQMINLKHNFYFYILEICSHLLDNIFGFYDNENFSGPL